jgi:pimeloyl-ACP methyl ester carboxylesterase
MRWQAPITSGMLPALALLAAFSTAAPAPAAAASPAPATLHADTLHDLHAHVIDLLPSPDATGVNDFFVVLEAAPWRYLVDDFHLVFLIEHSHGLLFADSLAADLSTAQLRVRLTGVEVEERQVNGQPARVIVAADSLYPDWPASPRGFALAEIDPGCPAPDFHHRYVRVPVSYDHPEWGTFELYYELSSDFDPSRPTVIVPTDGQRTFSQVGWADRYRQMFGLSQNVATYEYRGMHCAPIPGLLRPERDWGRAYEALKLANVVEDIERIRRDLPGDGPTYVLGGSGTAMVGLEYLAKYHEHIDRAFLMSLMKDAEASSVAGVDFFRRFLAEHHLADEWAAIRAAASSPGEPPAHPLSLEQVLFLVQRLLYHDQDEAAALIREVAAGQPERYDRWTAQLGSVDFFVRSAQRYRPWAVVFMWETNVPTAPPGEVDINGPFLAMGRPVADLVGRGAVTGRQYRLTGLEDVSTEVLLLAGTRDQVVPVEETDRIHRALPDSRFAIFEAYHTLAGPPEARAARNRIAELFFRHGFRSAEVQEFLASDEASGLVEVR